MTKAVLFNLVSIVWNAATEIVDSSHGPTFSASYGGGDRVVHWASGNSNDQHLGFLGQREK